MDVATDERLSELVSQMLPNDNDTLRNQLNAAVRLSLDFVVLTGLRRIENIFLP